MSFSMEFHTHVFLCRSGFTLTCLNRPVPCFDVVKLTRYLKKKNRSSVIKTFLIYDNCLDKDLIFVIIIQVFYIGIVRYVIGIMYYSWHIIQSLQLSDTYYRQEKNRYMFYFSTKYLQHLDQYNGSGWLTTWLISAVSDQKHTQTLFTLKDFLSPLWIRSIKTGINWVDL